MPREVAGALADLARAREAPYYDAEADARARETQCQGVDVAADP
jgi:hypothetical protein